MEAAGARNANAGAVGGSCTQNQQEGHEGIKRPPHPTSPAALWFKFWASPTTMLTTLVTSMPTNPVSPSLLISTSIHQISQMCSTHRSRHFLRTPHSHPEFWSLQSSHSFLGINRANNMFLVVMCPHPFLQGRMPWWCDFPHSLPSNFPVVSGQAEHLWFRPGFSLRLQVWAHSWGCTC